MVDIGLESFVVIGSEYPGWYVTSSFLAVSTLLHETDVNFKFSVTRPRREYV